MEFIKLVDRIGEEKDIRVVETGFFLGWGGFFLEF